MKESRIKVKISVKGGNPHDMTADISIDGEDYSDLFISRLELVVDGETSKGYLRLDFPTFDLEIDSLDMPVTPINNDHIAQLRRFLKVVDKKD